MIERITATSRIGKPPPFRCPSSSVPHLGHGQGSKKNIDHLGLLFDNGRAATSTISTKTSVKTRESGSRGSRIHRRPMGNFAPNCQRKAKISVQRLSRRTLFARSVITAYSRGQDGHAGGLTSGGNRTPVLNSCPDATKSQEDRGISSSLG